MTVVDIGKARRQDPDTMHARVDEDGDLVLKLPGVPRYAIANDVAIHALQVLLGRLVRARDRKLGVAPRVEQAPRADGPRACHKRRDGGCYGFGGCRRRRGHPDQCRDAEGSYTPAVCSHIGTGRCKVRYDLAPTDDVFGDGGKVLWTCQRCGQPASPP